MLISVVLMGDYAQSAATGKLSPLTASIVGRMDVTDVVELRVHGVSGTPPQDLLDRPLVTQVAGDGSAGFYRPRLLAERDDVAGPSAERTDAGTGAPLEGYVWGGLTSGSPGRALWLVLLPFTLINVAARLRPAARW